jgi:enediyne biosynthesis protein E4
LQRRNARIKIFAGGIIQTQEIHSGGSYSSQNDLRVHFGLGSAEKISSVEIHWSSGRVENLGDLAADRYYSILEGAGIVPAQRIRPAAVTGR